MDNLLPKIKRTVKAFLLGEDAIITNENAIRWGAFAALAGAAAAQAVRADSGYSGIGTATFKYSELKWQSYGGSTPSNVLGSNYDLGDDNGNDCHCNNVITETITPPSEIQAGDKKYVLVAKVDGDCHGNDHGNVHSNGNYDDCDESAYISGEIEKCNNVYHWNNLRIENNNNVLRAMHDHEVPADASSIDPDLKTHSPGVVTSDCD